MNEYRFTLASNKVTKLNCPYCGARKHWQRYIDTETGEILPPEYGRCDNEGKCGKWLSPYKSGYAKEVAQKEQNNKFSRRPQNRTKFTNINKSNPTDVNIPVDILKQTLQRYDKNAFIQNLLTRVAYPFDKTDIEKVVSLYYLGTVANGTRAGAITFPFIDKESRIKAIQVKEFDAGNHTKATDFLHSMIEKFYKQKNKPLPRWLKSYLNNEKKISCLFGEHLLKKYPQNPVALVEAPKTAIYGTLYFGLPENKIDFLWLAVYNLSSLTFDKVTALTGRRVVLFPDVSESGHAYREWKNKAAEFNEKFPETTFIVSDFLENHASKAEGKKGYDLADVLITKDWRDFRHKEPTPGEKVFEQMAASNPNLRELRERLDLTPGKVTRHEPMTREQLHEIAVEAIGYNSNLLADKIPHFQEMVTKGIIKYATHDRWYINGSNPF